MIIFFIWNGTYYEWTPMYGTGIHNVILAITVTIFLDGWLTALIGSWCNIEDIPEVSGDMPITNVSNKDREMSEMKVQ